MEHACNSMILFLNELIVTGSGNEHVNISFFGRGLAIEPMISTHQKSDPERGNRKEVGDIDNILFSIVASMATYFSMRLLPDSLHPPPQEVPTILAFLHMVTVKAMENKGPLARGRNQL